jgi:ubiquinone/menaquinone biosynthesis C-methylase UbiE
MLTGIWAFMLNNRAKKDSQKVLESLQINPGDVIADIGSGGGYFAFEFAKKVGGNGKVFAIDTNKNLLDYIGSKFQVYQIQNVVTIIGNERGFTLPACCNLMFMRNVFHHLSDAVPYFQNIKAGLKADGRIAIIEWSPDAKGSDAFHTKHSTPEADICKVMKAAGFQHLESFRFLDGQSFNIFKA